MNILDKIIMWLDKLTIWFKKLKEVIMNTFNKLTLWFKNFKKKKKDNGAAKIGK